jgi:hypothetical protein
LEGDWQSNAAPRVVVMQAGWQAESSAQQFR